MKVLKEIVDIKAPFESFLKWADNFETEFVKWSPLHLECDLFNKSINKGDRVRFYEIVMGLEYDVTGTLIESERDDNHLKITFESDKKTALITFEAIRTNEGFKFTHTESFGSQNKVFGWLINFLVFKVFYRKYCKWDLIQDDMKLDNIYLNNILTEGKYPERIAREDVKNHSPKELMDFLNK